MVLNCVEIIGLNLGVKMVYVYCYRIQSRHKTELIVAVDKILLLWY